MNRITKKSGVIVLVLGMAMLVCTQIPLARAAIPLSTSFNFAAKAGDYIVYNETYLDNGSGLMSTHGAYGRIVITSIVPSGSICHLSWSVSTNNTMTPSWSNPADWTLMGNSGLDLNNTVDNFTTYLVLFLTTTPMPWMLPLDLPATSAVTAAGINAEIPTDPQSAFVTGNSASLVMYFTIGVAYNTYEISEFFNSAGVLSSAVLTSLQKGIGLYSSLFFSLIATSVTNLTPPPSPAGLGISPNPSTTGQVTLSWTAASGATSYKVYRYTSYITTVNSSVTLAGMTTSTSYTENITVSGTYYYVVIASNPTGDSAISNCQTVVVTLGSGGTTAPGIPGPNAFELLLLASAGVGVIAWRERRKRKNSQ
ncbi:MAG TPA: fibronectin type III domain-containing protein [Candidatus Lokiarchaeia archaeon]|nr:fibronectin type III domain-containing protein [Candidatus Lokiarchaeia archaeon]